MHRKRLPWIVLLALVLTAAGFTVATQYTASALGYQRQLGQPPATVAGFHVYPLWSWIAWDSDFQPYAPRIFAVTRLIGWSTVLGIWLPLVLFAVISGRSSEASTSHGSARWAATRDLKAAGLLGGGGVVLCQTDAAEYVARAGATGRSYRMTRPGQLITHNGPEHVMVFAPTRSGKGVGTVVPTLLSWSESALVYDIKKELWTLTSGWRRQFSRCWRFEPTAGDSIRFNPLLEIRRGDCEVRDAQNVADILVDPDGSSEKRDHWHTSAHTLLVGSILHILYVEKDKSLAGVARFLSNPDSPIIDTFDRMLTTRHLPSGPHPVVAQCAREMLDKADNELASIVSTAKTCVNLYNDPLIDRNTRTSDFRISDLMQADDPVSLYLVVPPSDIDRTRPLIRLMLNQIGRRLTERMEFGDRPAYRHRLLFLLDELPSLGKLAFFQTQLAYLAGYGIKAFLIAQSLNQLEGVYGQHNSILDNCHVRLTYTALDDRTAKRISDLIGQSTHTKRQKSFSGNRLFRNVSESEQEHARPLLTPDEILRLPFEDALLLVGGVAPYRARKLMYYLDPRFKDRAKLPPPDSPRRRRAELLPNREPSDWETSFPGTVSAASPQPATPPVLSSNDSVLPGATPDSVGAFAAFFGPDVETPPAEIPAPPAGTAAKTVSDGASESEHDPDQVLPL